MRVFVEVFPALAWALLWGAGGWLLAASLFRLRRSESAMVGLGLGLVLQGWVANALAHWLPVMVSFWLASGLILAAGALAALRFRGELHLRPSMAQWALLGAVTILFNAIGRGLGIFDDYQNLPTVSLLAAGDIPPHFALNPGLSFGYHYLLLLLSAEVMRLGSMFPWSALDLTRALILALPLILAGLWGFRMTRRPLLAVLTSFMLAFAGGTRWLLLLLPPAWLATVSSRVNLIGSAAASASSFSEALVSNWKIDGAGPIPFPFAFYSGINQPYVMLYTGIAGSGILIMLLILLTANRWRDWTGAVVTCLLIASLALANEISFLLIGLGFILSVAAWVGAHRRQRPPHALLAWIAVFGGGLGLALVQGGMLTDLLRARIAGGSAESGYFDTTATMAWPPAVVSAHLGALSIFNLPQLLVAFFEIGPVILVTPLLFAWGRKSLRMGNWYEASLIAASWGSLLAIFISFKGPLFTATPRLMGGWFFACILYAVPLVAAWGRERGDSMRSVAVAGGLVTCLGGVLMLCVQLAAIQKPTYATFITPMDAKVSQEYWNRLRPGAWVFDPVVYRAPTVFGRFTDSSPSWYTRTADWDALKAAPDPYKMRSAGFSYMYFDSDFWNGLTTGQQAAFNGPCVLQLAQVNGVHSAKDYSKDFRRLLDINECR
jgi:hypothetical protein